MSVFTFKLPDIGEGIAEAEIAEWKVAVGDRVEEDQPLCDMLTDKAAVEIPAPVAGTIKSLAGQAGELVAVGSALLEIETDAAAAAQAQEAQAEEVEASDTSADVTDAAAEPASEEAASVQPARPAAGRESTNNKPRLNRPAVAAPAVTRMPAPHEEEHKPLASPAVRKRARDLGVDLRELQGTGPQQRVIHADLDAWESAASAPAAPSRPAHTASSAPATAWASDEVEDIPIIGLRRKIAQAMQQAKQRIPHFAYVEEVDVTELEALRQHLNAQRDEGQAKLTMLPFLMQAMVRVMPDFPNMNARYDDEKGVLQRHQALHVGIAAQTDQGLVVPVVRQAQTLDLWGKAAEIKRLAEAARRGRASREELSGSTITISSLGPMGGIVSTPVINAPEVAIVGVNKMVERAVFKNGAVIPRLHMNLSSSFDHRIIDGWDAASFIQAIKAQLEHPATLFL